jgi:hypothetical protein
VEVKGGDYLWYHLRSVSEPLHGKHDIELEQKSAQEVVDFVRSIQDEHTKEQRDF